MYTDYIQYTHYTKYTCKMFYITCVYTNVYYHQKIKKTKENLYAFE